MRATSSLLFAAALAAGCSALDNFGKFHVAADGGGGCTPGCDCIPADATLGVPDHCAITPSNGLSCTGAMHNADLVTLAGGSYILASGDPLGTNPPTLTGNGVTLTGDVLGGDAVFCIGSLVTSAPTRIGVTGHRPVVLLADSVVRFSGTLSIGGNYAINDQGATGVAGGVAGGDATLPGLGAGGGRAGAGLPGSGGGGGGSTIMGASGGASANAPGGAGGVGNGDTIAGFGGGGGGAGASKGGGGGGGGGFLQISAGWEIALDQAEIDASGGGGAGGEPGPSAGQPGGGGGGGGGGGVVLLEAPTVTVSGGCLSVIGGPGGGGGAGLRGNDARPATTCGFVGTGGIGGAVGGGNGGAVATNMPVGGTGTGVGGGGGGNGGPGRVTIRAHAPPPTSPGVVPAGSYVPAMLP